MSPDAIRRRVREKLQEQRELVEELLHQREQLQGSLFARWAVFGKEGCACREGRKHGPYYVLSTRSAGKGGFAYLENDQAAEALALVKRHRAFKTGMRQYELVNDQHVAVLRRYQSAIA